MIQSVRFPSLVTLALLTAIVCCQLTLPMSGQAQSPWTPDQLALRPGENLAGRLGAPDLTPPARTIPERTLPPLPASLRGSIRRVDTGGAKLVALTFDLCELADQKTGYDGAVVDALRSLNAPATFFAGGKWMRSHPERAMQLMADPLFELGSHAWTHGNFGVLDEPRMREQIAWTQAQYELLREELARKFGGNEAGDAVSRMPRSITVFRFPYGRCRAEALDMLAGMGLAAMQWDVNTMDAAPGRSGAAIARDVIRSVKPGSIVLGHANGFGHGTAEALRIYIPALRERGYRFVTASQLLASGTAVTAPRCYDSKPGDTDLYDALFGDGTLHKRNRP